MKAFIVFAKPLDKLVDFLIPPHPPWEALKRSLHLHFRTWASANIAIDGFGVRPVCLYRDDIETVVFNEMLSDFGTGIIEFMRPMRAATDKNNFVSSKFIECGAKGWITYEREVSNFLSKEILNGLVLH